MPRCQQLKFLLNSPSKRCLPNVFNATHRTSNRPTLSWKRIGPASSVSTTSRQHPLNKNINSSVSSRSLISFQCIPTRCYSTRLTNSINYKHLLELERKAKEYPRDANVQLRYLTQVSVVDLEHAIRWYERRNLWRLSDAKLNSFYSEVLRERRDPGNHRRDGRQSSGFDYARPQQPHEETKFRSKSTGSDPWQAIYNYVSGEKYPGLGQEGRQSSGSAQQPLLVQNGTGTKDRPLQIVMEEEKKVGGKRSWIRFVIVNGVFIYLLYKLASNFSPGQMMSGRMQYIPEKSSQVVRFDDVQGCDEAKAELQEVVQFLKDPEKFEKLGAKIPCGVLLVGPPGTGKTLLARAIAGEANVPFYFACGSEFDEMFVGVGASRIRKLFQAGKDNAPSIIFIDELDAVGGKRSVDEQSRYSRQTLNQLLIELDGFEVDQGVIVVAATNFPEVLDKALIRPGRFDSRVTVTLPDIKGRKNILKLYMDKSHCGDDVDVDVIARSTPGFSGAQLSNLVNQAALRAASLMVPAITMEHFEWARDKIIMGQERRSAVVEKNDQILTAYHEGGHAIVALFTEDADNPQKATIVPRGQALGYVMTLPTKDELSVSQKQLIAKMDVAMGGRVAEELTFGEDSITTGASSDFAQATRIARAMVTQYGFSDKVGVVLVDEKNNKISPELNKVIETEVRRLIQESYARAKAVLLKHEKEHKRLAEGLLKYETLTGDQIKKVIKGETLEI